MDDLLKTLKAVGLNPIVIDENFVFPKGGTVTQSAYEHSVELVVKLTTNPAINESTMDIGTQAQRIRDWLNRVVAQDIFYTFHFHAEFIETKESDEVVTLRSKILELCDEIVGLKIRLGEIKGE